MEEAKERERKGKATGNESRSSDVYQKKALTTENYCDDLAESNLNVGNRFSPLLFLANGINSKFKYIGYELSTAPNT